MHPFGARQAVVASACRVGHRRPAGWSLALLALLSVAAAHRADALASADVAVTKTGPATATAGATVTWTINVTNNGPDPADGVHLLDTLPAGATLVSQTQTVGPAFTLGAVGGAIDDTIATLANGASATIEVRATVTTAGSLSNTATVTTTAVDPNPSNDSSTTTTTVSPDATDPTRATATVPAGKAGAVTTITIQAKDGYGNNRTTGGDIVHATVTGANTATATITDLGNGTYTATYTPTHTGTDHIAIEMGATTMLGSPFNSVVAAGDVTHFAVTGPATAVAGVGFSATVTARDAYENANTSYFALLTFSSTDTTATLPPNTFMVAGTATVTVVLNSPGTWTVSAADYENPQMTGTTGNIVVPAAPATHFSVAAPATAVAGVGFSVTVTALDASNVTATGYAGTVHFTGTDTAGILPADATLTNGVGTFTVTLRTVGTWTVTATDTVTASITGTSGGITISPGPATHFAVAAPGTATAGTATAYTVTALDAFGNVATGYAGTAHFTGTDGAASLPANSTLTNGTGSFFATLRTVGNQTITATDTVTASITGTSGPITVSAGAATHFTVTAPGTAVSGAAFAFTVTALDVAGNVATAYAGTVHFTATDGAAVLPADGTLTNGTGSLNATLNTAGSWTITATDTVTAAITGTSGPIVVSPGTAIRLAVVAPATATAGVAFAFTVTARDAAGNVATGYAGTVHFTSTDGAAVLPADSTLANGTGSFNATLRTAGSRTITATDTVTASITGTSGPIAVSAGAATHFTVAAPSTAVAGAPFAFTVTALDAAGNVVTTYGGTVHFTATDGAAVLPVNSTLTNGTGSFNATLKTAGTRTITATDTVAASITGTSGPIVVSPGPATHFVIVAPSTATGGSPFTFTITAYDAYGNVVTGYGGRVHFSSNDPNAGLPGDSALNNGTGSFNATLNSGGGGTVTGTDTADAAVTGTSNPINVTTRVTLHLQVFVPMSTSVGAAFAFTVFATDQDGYDVTNYTGPVHFTCTDPAATLPADSTLTNGRGTFGATLRTLGAQGITATDTATPSITGTSSPIAVLGADLVVSKTHAGLFGQGQTGAVYTLTVTNQGNAATSGLVSVTDALPVGLTATAIAGAGWTADLATLTCTRSDALAAHTSYPPITVTVNVAPNAAATVTNAATVSGANDADTTNNTATDATTILGGISDPTRATAVVPDGWAGQVTTIGIQAKTLFGTNWTRGGDGVSVGVTGANTATATVVDNGNGTYTATYTPTVAGLDHVAITMNGTALTGSPFPSLVRAAAPDLTASTLTAAPPQVLADGVQAVTVTIGLRDRFGNPAVGIAADQLAVVSSLGSVTQPAAPTDAAGQTTAQVRSTAPGPAAFSASVGGQPLAARAAAAFLPRPVSAAQSTVTIDPPAIGVDGEQATLTVTLRDAGGLPVNGSPVSDRSFAFRGQVNDGSGLTLVDPGTTSDDQGRFTAHVSGSVVDRYAITVTVGGVALNPVTEDVRAVYTRTLGPGRHFWGPSVVPLDGTPPRCYGAAGWRMARWDPAAAAFSYLNPGEAADPLFSATAGRGLWVRLDQPLTVRLLGEPTPLASFDLALANGWTHAANPYEADLTLDLAATRVLVSGQDQGPLNNVLLWDTVRPYFWIYDEGLDDYALVCPLLSDGGTVVPRWAGFCAKALVDGATLRLAPPSPAGRRRAARAADVSHWAIRLVATGAAGGRAVTYAGVSGELASRLVIDPPPAGGNGGVSLAVIDGQGREAAGAIDPAARTASWDLVCRTAVDGRVSLTWPSLLRALPRGVIAELTDRQTGRRAVLNATGSYGWDAHAGDARRFTLTTRLGHLERADVLALAVTATRGGAGAAVSLTLSAPAEVTLTVRGLGGRLVRQVVLGAQPTGTTTAAWDGADATGRPVPAGTYLVEVSATAADGAVSRASRTVTVR